MKRRISRLIAILLLVMLGITALSACIDKSKWRMKEQGGPPNWQEERLDYGA